MLEQCPESFQLPYAQECFEACFKMFVEASGIMCERGVIEGRRKISEPKQATNSRRKTSLIPMALMTRVGHRSS